MAFLRRSFLKTSLSASTLVALGSTVPRFLARSAMAATPRRTDGDTVLVVVELGGGNDGLNTVVPYQDDVYAKSRPTLRMAPGKVHKIDEHLGFHPRMPEFLKLLRDGHLSVVQGVGYPNSSRDHNGAMHDWQTGEPGKINRQTGWLGRALDSVYKPDSEIVPAVLIGPRPQSLTLNAERAIVPAIQAADQLRLRTGSGKEAGDDAALRRRLARTAELPRQGGGTSPLDYVRRCSLRAYAATERIEAAAREAGGRASPDYPRYGIARSLRTVAQLIRADLGIRIFYTDVSGGDIGGFDNHANQRGNHCALLEQLSRSVAAFVADLKRDKLLNRVLLMTFSEFGRTVAENGRRGTGHGAAAPLFLVGGKLAGGLVGEHPSLADLDNGAQKPHTDFRRVYATALGSWLGIDPLPVMDRSYEPLDVFVS